MDNEIIIDELSKDLSKLSFRNKLPFPLTENHVDQNIYILKNSIAYLQSKLDLIESGADLDFDTFKELSDKLKQFQTDLASKSSAQALLDLNEKMNALLPIKSVSGSGVTFDSVTGDLKIVGGGDSLTQESVYQNLPNSLKAIVDGATTAISITTKKLYHFDDVSELNTVTKIGNPILDSVNKVFGTSSLYLDGSSYISIPTTDFASLGYFELSFRVRPRQNGKYWLMSIGSNAIRLSWESGSTGPQLYVGSANLGLSNQIAWDFPMDKFTHICLRRDREGVKLYIDGVLKLSSILQTAISASNWYIGANYDGTFKHQVNIDELRLATITYTDSYQVPQNAYIL